MARKIKESSTATRLRWMQVDEHNFVTRDIYVSEFGAEYQGFINTLTGTIRIRNLTRKKYIVQIIEGANLRTLQRKAKRMFSKLKVRFDIEVRQVSK